MTEPIDLVYMHGIINHLRDANQAYTNILTNLNEGGRIFISNYRSGSFVFFVVDFVRKIVKLSEMEKNRFVFKKIFPDLYMTPLQLTNTSGDHNEQFHSLFSCAWDDFFAPVVSLYNSRQLHSFFSEAGFLSLPDSDSFFGDYNHDQNDRFFQNPLYYFVRDKIRMPEITLEPVDQLNIDYKEKFIHSTVAEMRRIIDRSEQMDDERRIELALKVYEFAQNVEGVSALDRHEHLRKILKQYL